MRGFDTGHIENGRDRRLRRDDMLGVTNPPGVARQVTAYASAPTLHDPMANLDRSPIMAVMSTSPRAPLQRRAPRPHHHKED